MDESAHRREFFPDSRTPHRGKPYKSIVAQGRKLLDSYTQSVMSGNPDDIAYGVLCLASDEAKFVTGTELVIDGGYTAQ